MSTPLAVLAGFLAFFFSSFIFWRRLREDYPPGKIFSFTLVLLMGGVLGGVAAKYLLSSSGGLATFSFWLPFLLISLLTLYLVKKLDLRLFEVLDSLVPSGLLFMVIYSLELGLFDRRFLVEAGLALFGLITYWLLRGRYRRFSWYPSGRVGFLGLVTLTVYLFVRFLVAILFLLAQASPVVLSFSLLSLILSFFFLFAVYLRSGRMGAEKLIVKWSNRHFLSVWKK